MRAEARIISVPDVVPAPEAFSRQRAWFDAVVRGEGSGVCLLWRSAPAVIATTLDAALPGLAPARSALAAEGWPVVVRRSGGGAFAVGPGTLQVTMIVRCAGERCAIEPAYEALAYPIVRALQALGLDASVGAVPDAMCGGRYDIAVAGRKLAGLAQHWRRAADGAMCAAVTASLIVEADARRLVDAVNRFYALAGSSRRYSPDAMTSIAAQLRAVGRGDAGDLVARVISALTSALRPRAPEAVSAPTAASREYSSPA